MDAAKLLERPYARLVLRDEDGSFAAEIVEFPGCVASGDTAAEALEKLDEVAIDWIDAAREQGQEIPEPMETRDFSGKTVLRMPSGLHKRAAMWAEREGASLNQFLVTCIAEAVGERAPRAMLRSASSLQFVAQLTVGNAMPLGISPPQQQQLVTPSTAVGWPETIYARR